MTHYSTKKDDSDALELREAIHQLFFVPVHISHQNVTPHEITITNEGKDYYINKLIELFTAHTERAVEEALEWCDSLTNDLALRKNIRDRLAARSKKK